MEAKCTSEISIEFQVLIHIPEVRILSSFLKVYFFYILLALAQFRTAFITSIFEHEMTYEKGS
jgi:hypothetical protein